eukprot:c19442_g1_i1 orf=356-3073(+)
MEKASTWTSVKNHGSHAHSQYRGVAEALHNVPLSMSAASVEPIENISQCLISSEGDASQSSHGIRYGGVISLSSSYRGVSEGLCSLSLKQPCISASVKPAEDSSHSSNSALRNTSLMQQCILASVNREEENSNSSGGDRLHGASHGVYERGTENPSSNSTTNVGCHYFDNLMGVGHPSSSTNFTTSFLQSSDSTGLSHPCRPLREEPAQRPSSKVKKFPILVKNKSARHLVGCWPKERGNFIWMQCKAEVLCTFTSFDILLVLILVDYWITGRQKLAFVLPWIAMIMCASLQLCALMLDYVQRQALCFYMSPLLFILAFLSWLLPSLACDSATEADDGFFATMGLVVSISLPWLLSTAPIMAWQAALFLSLVMPFLFVAILFTRVTAMKLTVNAMAFLPIVVLFATTNVLLWHLRSVKASKTLALIDTWANAFLESKEHEEQALDALEERERDNADRISKMRQFISYIFHEIRVPFNAVMLGIGHILASDITDEQQEILNMMDMSSSSMIRILNDVLDMGKIEAGKLHLEKQPFNMGEMVSSLVWAYKDTMDSKGIEFSLSIDPTTKQLFSSYDLLGDKHRVRQVVANYLSNAAKFTPRGGKVTLRIVCNGTCNIDPLSGDAELMQLATEKETFGKRIGHSRSGKCLSAVTTDKVVSITVSVEDTGIGISKEDQAILFEPYIQISASSSQGGGGTGLGLSFAKRIVELAGGKIGVFSDVGKGSIFEFTMPFRLVEYVKDRAAQELQRSSAMLMGNCRISSCPPFDALAHKPRVLIVEDNVLNRKIIRKLLESFHMDSDDAENGKEAVELCESRSYDMILIDKEMPVMDGHEATRQLRAMGVKSPIIGLTGNALNSDRNEFIAAGVDDFFTKPISRHQLVKLLEAYGLIPKTKDKAQMPTTLVPVI